MAVKVELKGSSRMTITEDLKKKAKEAGFVSVGISSPNMLQGLPHGWVSTVCNLRSPEEELSTAKSVMLMGYYAWDKSFNLAVDSTYLWSRDTYVPEVPMESYQLYYEVLKNKAWRIVNYLIQKGYESRFSLAIPLKTAAVRSGLGCQGKNTLLITPEYGPRIRLISVLTAAELDTDKPCKDDLCGECEKCIIACPTKALEPYKIVINRCLTYAAEKPRAQDVPDDIRKIEKRLVQRPTPNSYIECSICIEACPIGKPSFSENGK
ncbi:MAG: epoxyqueuosine reductase [Candidatus Bathyarchaeota archaeon]|nr:MAG: epoxyqueuosine reductase [Candidatus Bathyarchaeota archaeon]